MDEEKRNILAFFAVCILIMVGYPYFLGGNGGSIETSQQQMLNQQTQQQIAASRTNQSANLGERSSGVNGVGSGASLVSGETPSRTFLVSNDPVKAVEVRINSKKMRGTISTLGMHFNNIQLKKYRENDDKISNVSIFGKPDAAQKYYASLEWTTEDPNVLLPNNDTIWEMNEDGDSNDFKNDNNISSSNDSSEKKSKSSKILSEKSPIKVSWDNKNGLSFEREISIDDNYVVTITDKVQNYGSQAVVLKSSAKIHREFEKDYNNSVAAYEGPLGYFNGKLEEFSYKDISKKGRIENKANGGWFGITDKYWLVAFIPDQKLEYSAAYSYRPEGNKDLYDVESTSESIILAPSQEISKTYHLFMGAKEIDTLDMYEKKLGIEHFDLAIDFGYLYVLTKPMLYCLAFANDTLGSMGLAILLLTLLIKMLLLPLAQKSYKSMNRMKYIQPKVQALQKRYADDKVKLGQAVSELYKKEGVNPVGGCLPAMLQAPVLFALYKVIYVSIEMRQAPFYGWITDLSMPDPMWILNLGGLLPYGLPGFLQIGVWPVLMGLSMYLQQKLTPASPDPSQAKMMILMPVMFTFMFAQLPSGLVIYWTFSNILSWGHQYWLMKCDEKNAKKWKSSKIRKKAAKMISVKELFSQKPQFTAGASTIDQIPRNLFMPEIAFVGRSNVGKSSLVNAITGDQTCARVSKHPGRTQQINFFTLQNRISLVDLPGYGYAAVSKSVRKSWDRLILDYLRGRPNLRRIFLLIDSRHGLKNMDKEIMDILDESAVVYQVVLTKIDKILGSKKATDEGGARILESAREKISAETDKRTAAFPEILATSSEKMIGIYEVQKAIADVVNCV